ncbi:MAG: hypothetical protein HY391_05230 [Deltaproteobacteria bacterium]|nr:hypothetical protein [Deltaproteobacteria bacterium]
MRIEFTEELQSTRHFDHLNERSTYIVHLKFDSGIPLHLYYKPENMFYAVIPDNDKKILRLYRIHFNEPDELESFRKFFFQEDLNLLSDPAKKQFESLVQGKLIGLERPATPR